MRRGNSHLGSKHNNAVTSAVRTCIKTTNCLKQLPYSHKHMAVLPHLRPDPLHIYLLTTLGTCTPAHENTPSARVQPRQQEHDHSHFTSLGPKNVSVPLERAAAMQLEQFANFAHLKTSLGLLVLLHHTSVSPGRHSTVISSAGSQARGQC